MVGDASGNTIGCRVTHVELASPTSDPDVKFAECAAASPTGGGMCGTETQNFCDAAATVCVGDLALAWTPDCPTVAATWPTGAFGDTTLVDPANTLYCRWNALGNAAVNDPIANCPYVAQASPFCADP